MRVTVTCDGVGLDGAEIAHVAAAIAFGIGAEIAHVAAAIAFGIAVDEFAVGARGGHANAIIFSWDGGKVAGKDQRGIA